MRIRAGLRTEIVVQMTLLLGAALLLGGFLLLKLAERELLEQKIEHLSGAMEMMAIALMPDPEEKLITQQTVSRARSFFQALVPTDALVGWLVASDRSEVQTSFGLKDFSQDANALEWVIRSRETSVGVEYPPIYFPWNKKDPGRLQITVALQGNGKVHGAIQAQFSLLDIRKRIAVAHGVVFLYSLLYGAVLISFGVFLLSRSVIGPIRQLMYSTRQITEGNLETVELAGPSEIEELAVSFNGMVSALRESRQETEDTIRVLEKTNSDLKETRDGLVRAERMASIGHLAAGMAHEIGNPLGALVGYLGLLQGELPPGPAGEIAARALTEAERIDRLVRDLLDYAAPPAVETGLLDPVEVIAEARVLLEQQNAFEGMTIEMAFPSLPPVRITKHRLVQVLINLLLNARDAVAQGRGFIRLIGFEDEESVCISVIDNGVGIDHPAQAHIFDPFYTTKAPGKGRGLGLSVCHRIISDAGGRMEVDSEKNAGSTFTIHLPKVGSRNGN